MKVLSSLLLGTALSFMACRGTQTSPEVVSKAPIMRPTSINSSGMVAAANPHAVEAGLEILAQGGSAIDAAIAVQTVLGLVEPQSSGIGGGAFLVLFDNQSGQVWVYDGRETAPAHITPELFYDDNGEPLRYFEGIVSGRSTGVPGAMAMLGLAHKDYGKLPWGIQMEPAIKLAENGFAISPRLARLIKIASQYALSQQAEARDYFFEDDGTTPLPVGFIRDNQPYAQTLRALQNDPRALLKPPLANDIIKAIQEEPRPGVMTLDDMEVYQPKKYPALCGSYRDHTICGARPPSSGGTTVLSILGILEHFDMATLGQTLQGWHIFSEASFLAYADRDQYVADEAFVDVPVDAMIDKSYLASRAKLIQPDQPMDQVKAGNPAGFLRGADATPDSPGTSHFTVVDADGLTVSMTTTVESLFGSQRMAAGFMLNNQLTDFSFKTHDETGQAIANAPAAGKRPRSSMSPTIVFDENGEFLFTTGSPGGSSIIAYTSKTIIGILDWGLSPQEAIDLPNITARNGTIRVEEARIDPALSLGLENLGHKVTRSKGENSGLHIILRKPDGSLIGAADPRREGIAKSLPL